jgi:hypothetical protein
MPSLCILALSAALAVSQVDSTLGARDVREDTTAGRARLEFLDLFAVELLEECARLLEEPVDLNRATEADLERIPLLTQSEVAEILRFRNERGGFRRVSDLLALGDRLYSRVAPFAFVEQNAGRTVPLSFRIRATRSWRDSNEIEPGALSGSPWKLYTTVMAGAPHGDHLSVVARKDAAEPFRYAFLSASCALRDVLLFDSIILGDFMVNLGDGTVAGRESRFSRGYDPVAASGLSGASAYHSSDEGGYLRGVALSARREGAEILAFGSRRRISATMNEDGTIASIYRTGLFSTARELEKRNVAAETVAGWRVSCAPDPSTSIGLTYLYSQLSAPYRMETRESAVFRTAAVELHTRRFGIDLDAAGALSLPQGFAGRVSVEISATKDASIALSYREYSVRFENFHAGAFGEHSDARNERGFYLGMQLRLTPAIRLSGYADLFTFPSPARSRSSPPLGREWSATLDLAPVERVSVFCTVKGRMSEKPVSEAAWSPLRSAESSRLRLSGGVLFTLSRRVRLFSRWDYTVVDEGTGKLARGYLALQELVLSLLRHAELSARILLYETSAYASRLYCMERDVPGTFTAPSLYGSGTRWHLLLRSGQMAGISLAARYSGTTAHRARGAIGDFPGTSDGTELSLQIDFHH